MENTFQKLKDNYIKKFSIRKEEINYEEYLKLDNDDRDSECIKGVNQYYKVEPGEFTEDEYNQSVQLMNYYTLKSMDEKISSMKGIMTFWLILTVINIACVIYVATKVASVFSEF